MINHCIDHLAELDALPFCHLPTTISRWLPHRVRVSREQPTAPTLVTFCLRKTLLPRWHTNLKNKACNSSSKHFVPMKNHPIHVEAALMAGSCKSSYTSRVDWQMQRSFVCQNTIHGLQRILRQIKNFVRLFFPCSQKLWRLCFFSLSAKQHYKINMMAYFCRFHLCQSSELFVKSKANVNVEC